MKRFVVLKLNLEDNREMKRKALKTASTLSGIDGITVDSKAKTMTVIGTVDPVDVVCKLRKKEWQTSIAFVGPVTEQNYPAQKGEGKKEFIGEEDPSKKSRKKKETNKEKKGESTSEEKHEEKKAEAEAALIPPSMPYMQQYYQSLNSPFSVNHSIEDNPGACVIC